MRMKIIYFATKILEECVDDHASWMAIRSYAIEIIRLINEKDNQK